MAAQHETHRQSRIFIAFPLRTNHAVRYGFQQFQPGDDPPRTLPD